jgi:hypothetical protein
MKTLPRARSAQQHIGTRWLVVFGACLLTAATLFACSASSEDDTFGDPSGTGASGNGGNGNGGGLNLGGNNLGGGSGCENTCSADLKKVLDCDGGLVKQCSGDQGCAGGECIDDPCQAAEASKSSYGCNYWALKTDLIVDGSGACFAAFIANTWSVPVHIEVERAGQLLTGSFIGIPQGQGSALTYAPYDPAAGLAVGEVAILFLSRDSALPFLPDCPMPAALNVDSSVIGTGRGQAFNIRTDRPVVAYQILPYGGGPSAATSASLLLPTSALDTNYVAVNAYAKSTLVPEGRPSLDILAIEDATSVTVLPKAAIQGGAGVDGAAANTPVTYTLSRGEYVQITQDAELTGSPIQSDKPVAVFGGASCLNIPVGTAACDSAHQQIPPIRALGNEYVGLRYRGRAGIDESVPWRLVGAVDGTQLTWEPTAPPGALTTLDQGQVMEFQAPGPFIVRSQDANHPFYMAAYMTGADTIGSGEGDPEWVNVIPGAQYLDSYVLFTDPTYSETSLNVVRRPDKNGMFADVTLDCAGALSGWQKLGNYEWTRVDMVTGDFTSVNGCANGRHTMSSALPFGVTVWGWGSFASTSLSTTYVSYAYPAGASVEPINEVVVPPVPK